MARTEDAKTGKLKPGAVRGAHRRARASPTPRSRWSSSAPSGSSRSSSTTCGCPPTRSSATRTPPSRSFSPGSTPSASWARPAPVGMGRFALDKAVDYVKTRQVWGTPIGAHQGLSHPLAQCHIEVELAKLMMQKAAALYDAGDDMGAGEAANMAKYAAAEAATRSVDQAVQSSNWDPALLLRLRSSYCLPRRGHRADRRPALPGLRRPLTHVGALLDAAALQPSRSGAQPPAVAGPLPGPDAPAGWTRSSAQAGLQRCRPAEGGRLLPGHAAAAGHRRGAARRPAGADARRAVQRHGPRGDRVDARVPAVAGRRGPGGAGLQPPDERTAGHRRPPGDRRPRQGDRRHQRRGPDRGRVRRTGSRCAPPRPAEATAVLARARGRRSPPTGPARSPSPGWRPSGSCALLGEHGGAVLRGVRAPGDAGGGLHGAHQGRGRVPRRAAPGRRAAR